MKRATAPRKTHEVSKSQLWAAQELRSFLTTAESHRLYALYWLAAYTGMRRGEIVALRWSDVDFEKKLIRVHRSVTLTDAGQVEVTAKSGKNVLLLSTIKLSQCFRLIG
ncbi:tyrosine-type recombinase/integrase [Rothia sp. ND6WE1A]|uniref:tyrosine-type recombinase/integrase n=1 Tax=Rothia sp. ND6WE1A TaxID=1848190 RepID=UPI00083597F8|nr:tyrosine-type recombinase/integrase [Rothia sp. ND6WE1A]